MKWSSLCPCTNGKAWLRKHGAKNWQYTAASLIQRISVQFSSVQSLSRVRLFANPWTAAQQASLSITNSWSLLKLMSIKLAMPSNHLILCRPLLLLPSTLPSIRVFSHESALCIRWPKDWSFSFSVSPSNEYSGLISFRSDYTLALKMPKNTAQEIFPWSDQKFPCSVIHEAQESSKDPS